ncbi:hypothetical protein GUITHDRAFT_138740 [Guillardia theta CCMP2712]|uniref:RWP-RK domain-containing protein n=1 Tax=Guillardia theta (strain CCMP2712) TaxID=905079 RepID=L1JCT8_GUITC|nr:hypothetical protein GUITHDRAFT_138740 [Guillardia theta CCMP2712]EKX45915.1 hypothetical protein GUITHDRAFT_138740 [Guillardia theta CCMP2712]|eukprot:XP_005832895.1 hypothetical protein GUITHDRAFT_138740 [Guillardia theta CCMP2712]
MQQLPLGMQHPLANFAVSQSIQQRCGLQAPNAPPENAQIAIGLNSFLLRGIQDKSAGQAFNPNECHLPGIQANPHVTMGPVNTVSGMNPVLHLGMSSAFTCVRDALKGADESASIQSAVQSITASAQAMAQNIHVSQPFSADDSKAQGSDEDDSKKKSLIGAELAARIYAMRPPRTQVGGQFNAAQGLSPTAVGNLFGVSSKVVRDIWNRRTWIEATRSLWSDFEVASHLIEMKTADPDLANKLAKFKPLILKRKPGRPPGAKDFVPRQRRKRDVTSGASQENAETATGQTTSQPQQLPAAATPSLVAGNPLASNLQLCTQAIAQSLVNPVLKLERNLAGLEQSAVRTAQDAMGGHQGHHEEGILSINQADPFASDWQHLLKESDVMV